MITRLHSLLLFPTLSARVALLLQELELQVLLANRASSGLRTGTLPALHRNALA
jgi:hypothetical protein